MLLTCVLSILVDDTNYSNLNWTSSLFNKDSHTSYKINCNNCRAKFTPMQLSAGGVYLVDSTTGKNLKYKWYFGDGDSSSTKLPTHTYVSAGKYNVCLYIEDTIVPCSDYFCDTITVDSTGILRNSWVLKVVESMPVLNTKITDELEIIKVYPNPNNGVFIVDLGEKTKLTSMRITDLRGRLIQEISIKNISKQEIDFELDLQYAGFSRNDDKMEFFKSISKTTKKYYEGKFGKGKTSSRVKIKSQYGGVSIK